MRHIRKWWLPALGATGALASAFVWGYAPRRARKLSARYAKFRADFQPTHDAIDAEYRHCERIVGGIRWHYVDEGAPDGEVILFLHGLPEGWYSWSDVLARVDHSYRLIAIDGYYVVAHDWGSIIGSVLVSDHPDHILGFVRMEADLIQKESAAGRAAAYLKKPQWLLFRSTWLATYLMRDAGRFIDRVYSSRMQTELGRDQRDYLVYEFSRPGVAEMNPRYFKHRNWDLDAALGKICANTFPFPVLQLQADGDPAQPPSVFADVTARCPNVRLEWVTAAGHFDNFDQPAQVAAAINRFVHLGS